MSKQLPDTQTSRKVKYVGTKKYLDPETGEIEEFQVSEIEERDFNFSKVWMRNFILTLNIVGNSKTKLAMWIIDNLNKENQLLCTLQEMSESNNMSLETVRVTMNLLRDANFLRKIRNGAYVVNPNIVFKGTRQARLNILNQYQELGYEPPKLTDEEKVQRLEEAIADMQKTLTKLKKNMVVDAQIDGQLEMMPDGTIAERAKDERE